MDSSPKFKAVTVYLTPGTAQLLNRFGKQNRLTDAKAIETILNMFFDDEDVLDQMMATSNLETRIDTFEARLLTLAKTVHCQVESMESIERRMAHLEYSQEKNR